MINAKKYKERLSVTYYSLFLFCLFGFIAFVYFLTLLPKKGLNTKNRIMKRLVWIILATATLIACSDNNNGEGDETKTPPPGVDTAWLGDWNNDKDDAYKPEYKGKYNPIHDDWKVVKKNGKAYNDLLLYHFWSGPYGEHNWSTATHLRTEAPLFEPFWEAQHGRNEYKINDKQFMFEDGTIFEYSLTVSKTEDKLQIYDGRDLWELVPYTDSWTWKGDWNDPLDRHYTAYQGKYNPLGGTTWKYIYEDGKPVSEFSSYYYIFDKDTTLLYWSENQISKDYTNKFTTNSSFLRVHYTSLYMEYRYKIKLDTLYFFYKTPSNNIIEYKYLKIK